MQDTVLEQIAADLRTARAEGRPIPTPSKTYPDLDAEAGFTVQRLNVELAVAGGDRVAGYKLGNIAKVMQDAFGLDHPDYGYLLASTFAYEGTTLRLDNFIAPYVELEPAFILRKSLGGPNVTVADVIDAVEYSVPAIEIIDSRVQDWQIDLGDTLADNGSTGAILLGGTPRRLHDLNLADTIGTMSFNGVEIGRGNTHNILGNPLAAVAWVAKRLSVYDITFQPGQVILPGSCVQALPMREPGHWTCSFEGFGTVDFDVA